MSIAIMARVWADSKKDGGVLLVLLALADFANDDGECWPHVETLAKKARLSVRQTHRALKDLAEAQEIEMPTGERSQDHPFRVVCHSVVGRQRHVEGDAGVAPDATPTSGPYVEPSGKPPENPQEAQALFEADGLIEEIHVLYRSRVPGKSGSRLTPKAKKMIANALKARPAEKVKLAIIGLSMSDHHRDGGFLGLEYAIAKGDVGDRIDMMAAKAPRGAMAAASDGRITVEELLRPYSGYSREKVAGLMGDVRRALIEPSAQNQRIAEQAEAWLREHAQIIVVERSGRQIVWGKA